MVRFGLQIPNFSFGVPDDRLFEQVVSVARAGEETGFESLWVMDHFYQLPPLGGADQPMLEAYTLLGALGAKTERARLGALVTGVTYRNPALVAKIITTLDVITAGRAILGLGAAWHDVEHEGLGFDFPPVRERMDRLEEALKICRAMFREESPTLEGRHYRIHEARNVPRPIQPGGPAILVGGSGERRTLRLVAQYADMCNIVGDADTIRRKVAVLHAHCVDVGRDSSQVVVSRLSTLVVTDSDDQTKTTREMVERVAGRERAATFNIGQEKEILDQIDELTDAGVEYFIFNLPLSDVAGVRRAGELLISR